MLKNIFINFLLSYLLVVLILLQLGIFFKNQAARYRDPGSPNKPNQNSTLMHTPLGLCVFDQFPHAKSVNCTWISINCSESFEVAYWIESNLATELRLIKHDQTSRFETCTTGVMVSRCILFMTSIQQKY